MAGRETYNNNQTISHSPWHSPVPYLFGGLAAMLGLIAFALLILACSYWKLSGYLENSSENQNGDRDLEAGDGKPDDEDGKKTKSPAMQEKFLVIMAGDVKPTYLATLSSASTSRSSSFMESNKSCTCKDDDDEGDEEGEKEEEGNTQVGRQSTGS